MTDGKPVKFFENMTNVIVIFKSIYYCGCSIFDSLEFIYQVSGYTDQEAVAVVQVRCYQRLY